ncbi:MAG: hypothetical protein HYS39_02800, partial [Proteobacteria bacterium]|nr:hypothetical protein [Pseudomonadota bacterium]
TYIEENKENINVNFNKKRQNNKNPKLFIENCKENSPLTKEEENNLFGAFLLNQTFTSDDHPPSIPFGSPASKKISQFMSPTKINEFKDMGGCTETLSNNIESLKERYPKKIKKELPNGQIWSSPSRFYIPRTNLKKLQNKGIIVPVRSLDFDEIVLEETEEEIKERKKRQEKAFQEIELSKGRTVIENATSIQQFKNKFELYFKYILKRKEEIVTRKGKKFRKQEIIEAFNRFVTPYLKSIKKDLYSVYYDPNSIKLDRTNAEIDNEKLLEIGDCPIGDDGKPMHYHHLTHHDSATHKSESVIVLLPDTFHKQCSGLLHFPASLYTDRPKKPVNRNLFSPNRQDFSKQILKQIQNFR